MDSLNLPAREALTDLCRRWQVMELAVFGSVARGSSRPDSDLDLLVTFAPDASRPEREARSGETLPHGSNHVR